MMNKINPLNSIGNALNFMLLVMGLVYLGDSFLSIKDKVMTIDLNGPDFTMAMMLTGFAIANISLHSKGIESPFVSKYIIKRSGRGFAEISDEEKKESLDKISEEIRERIYGTESESTKIEELKKDLKKYQEGMHECITSGDVEGMSANLKLMKNAADKLFKLKAERIHIKVGEPITLYSGPNDGQE